MEVFFSIKYGETRTLGAAENPKNFSIWTPSTLPQRTSCLLDLLLFSLFSSFKVMAFRYHGYRKSRPLASSDPEVHRGSLFSLYYPSFHGLKLITGHWFHSKWTKIRMPRICRSFSLFIRLPVPSPLNIEPLVGSPTFLQPSMRNLWPLMSSQQPKRLDETSPLYLAKERKKKKRIRERRKEKEKERRVVSLSFLGFL